MRNSLSLIMVCMVKDVPGNSSSTGSNHTEGCIQHDLQIGNNETSRTNTCEGEMEWDGWTRGLVLSSFSWGYITSQILGGRLSELYGFKLIYGLGLTIPAFLMLLHPFAARTNVWLFIAVRVLFGVAEGVTWPSMHAITARWVPSAERSSFISQSYFGSTFGSIITFPMCGFIMSSLSWDVCFYVISGISLAWSIVWFSLIHNTPEQHPRITQEELQELSGLARPRSAGDKLPWFSILTSPPIWGTLITDCCNSWGIITVAAWGPQYMKYIIGLDIKSNGILSSLPMVARYIGGVTIARFSDFLISSGRLSLLTSRRVFNTISQVIPAITVVSMGYVGCNPTAVVTVNIIGMFFNGAISSGHFASGVDLAPNYAGTIFGFTNTVSGGGMGMLMNLAGGAITQGKVHTWAPWRTMFWTAAAFYVVGNCVYVALIQGKAQTWNEKQGKDEEVEKSIS